MRTAAGVIAASIAVSLCAGLALPSAATVSDATPATADAEAADAPPAPPEPRIALHCRSHDTAMRPLGEGYCEWMRRQLQIAGVPIESGPLTRRRSAPDADDAALRAAARERGLPRLGVVDLRSSLAGVEVDVAVFDLDREPPTAADADAEPPPGEPTPDVGVAPEDVAFAAHIAAPAETITARSHGVLVDLLGSLGTSTVGLPPAHEVGVDPLSAISRALRHQDHGRLARAWKELDAVAGSSRNALLSTLRTEIEALAGLPATPVGERARVLALRGEGEAAWAQISGQARLALDAAAPDVALLLAAGDVLFEMGRLRQAGIYYDKAAAVEPTNLDAALGRARLLAVQRKQGEALEVFRYARELAPRDAGAALAMAELEDPDPARYGSTLLAAGELAADDLRYRSAVQNLRLAERLDPRLSATAQEEAAALHQGLGQHDRALQAYQTAVARGGGSLDRFQGMARSQRALGRHEAAELSLLQAVEIDADDESVLRDLGGVYIEMGRTEEAIAQLERAMELAPTSTADRSLTQRKLARALSEDGQHERALKLMVQANRASEPQPRDLLELAYLQRALGQPEAAQESLGRAMAMRRMVLQANPEFSDLYGGKPAAAGQARHSLDEVADPVGKAVPEGILGLIRSFVGNGSTSRVIFLGTREKPSWHPWFQPARPLLPDLQRIDGEISEGISHFFTLGSIPADARFTDASIDVFYDFDSPASRDGEQIVDMNKTLRSDAIFVAQLDGGGGGCAPGELGLELRSLGAEAGAAKLLGNRTCLPGGVEAGYQYWNRPALGVAAAILLLLLFRLVRGYGTLQVDFDLPPGSEALFAVSLTRRPKKFKASDPDRQVGSGWLYEKRLQKTGRWERRLKGSRMLFRAVPARWSDYYVTVRGPMMDRSNNRLIGDFLEEKTVRVKAWRRVTIEFDFQPKECAVELRVMRGQAPVDTARVLIKGQPASERYSRDGAAYLFVGLGEHILAVCDGATVLERELVVSSAKPMQVTIDVSKPDDVLFADCPEAVSPYLLGDAEGTADALEAAGQREIASRLRAESRLGASATRGPTPSSTVGPIDLEAGGEGPGDRELSALDREALADNARLLEQAGELARAAELYYQSGDFAAAGRAFEAAYDYENAVDCYRQLGDDEKVVSLLEAKGDFFEAGELADEKGQKDRAIAALQQIDGRHPRYAESCRLLGRLLAARGDTDVAIGKFEEAIAIAGDEHAPLDDLARYGELLEQQGRSDEAMTVYEKIRRRDLGYGDVNTRIENLRKEQSQPQTAGDSTVTVLRPRGDGDGGSAVESRYEVLSELGRGGMGVVYKARDKHLGRTVALKVLPENLRQHPTALELFEREARSAAVLNHPNIVTVFDAGREGDSCFMTMECLEGLPLDQILRNKGLLATKLVAELGAQAAAGLEYARQQRIVHRDIKPSNMFVTRERVVKIMDFGLAKMIEEVRRNSTMIGGTPNFMAPEQAGGEAVDHRTDLYALGVSLFQLLSGTVPFEGGDLAYHHRHTPPPDVRERQASVPPAMAQLILKLMAKDPAERVQTAGEVQRILLQIRDAC